MATHSDRYWDDDERAPVKALHEPKKTPCDQWGFLGSKLLKSIAKSSSSDTITDSDDDGEDYFYCGEFRSSLDDLSLEDEATPVSSEGSTVEDDEYNAEIMDSMIYEKMW